MRLLLFYIQGFRKVDPDKWEFANEGFLRGNRHLLKNIRRRKSHHTQQLTFFGGSTSESDIGSEIEKLKTEKSTLMHEVVELQQQQRGTAQRVEKVKDRLHASEQRQKQMVSFLAQVIQNPVFVDRVKEMNERNTLVSPRRKRRFLKQMPQQGLTSSSTEGEIVRYRPDFEDLRQFPSSEMPISSAPDYQDVLRKVRSGAQALPSQIGNVSMNELAAAREYRDIPGPVGAYPSNYGIGDPFSKSTHATASTAEADSDYFVSFPEELTKERTFSEFSSGIGNMIKQEGVWSTGFDLSNDISNSSPPLWGNVASYGLSEMGTSCPNEFSDVLHLSSLQVGSSEVEIWPGDDSTFGHPDSKDFVPKSTN